jgi:serine/threonine protein kinase
MSLSETPPEFAAAPLIGGRYRLGEPLGSGRAASVYRAVDQLLGRPVAVKLFPGGGVGKEGVLGEEALLLASLNHHSLVTLLDAGYDTGGAAEPRAYLVLELVEGTDLRRRLESGVLPRRTAAYIGADIADALDHIQGRGIVHRDVKPENVLLPNEDALRRPRAKLADFGIAALVSASPGATGIERTRAYLSPEQAAGAPGGPSSDVYSLGLVILESLTGRIAFPASVTDAASQWSRPNPEIPSTLPADWHDLLAAMTARDGALRPTPADAAAAFRQLATQAEQSIGGYPVADEEARLANLARYDILDTAPEEAFDRITSLVSRTLQVPISTVSIVDRDRIWFKSHHGVGAEQIGRDPGFCAAVVETGRIVHVPDATADPATCENPLVTGLGVRFYAGAPLIGSDGFALGSLSALDTKPRNFTEEQFAILESLADMATHELERHRATLLRQA